MTNTITIPVEFFEQIKKDRDIWQEKYYVQKHNAEKVMDELQSKGDGSQEVVLAFEKARLIKLLHTALDLAGCGVYHHEGVVEEIRELTKMANKEYPQDV